MSDVSCTIGIFLVDACFKNYHNGSFYAEIFLKYAASNINVCWQLLSLIFIPAHYCQCQLLYEKGYAWIAKWSKYFCLIKHVQLKKIYIHHIQVKLFYDKLIYCMLNILTKLAFNWYSSYLVHVHMYISSTKHAYLPKLLLNYLKVNVFWFDDSITIWRGRR